MRVLLSRRRDEESGAVAIVVAMLALALFGLAAFTTDLGTAYVGKRQQQTAADSAALAAAAVYAPYAGSCSTLLANTTARAAAQAAADAYRTENAAGTTGTPLSLACVGGDLQVTTAAQGTSPTLLGGVLGVSAISTARSATAALDVPPTMLSGGLRPLALCSAALPSVSVQQSGAVIRVDYPGDGHRAFPGCPDTSAAGDWWTLDCPGERTGSTTQLETQIAHGCPERITPVTGQEGLTATQLSALLTAACPSAPTGSASCLSGDPGQLDSGHVADAWDTLMTDETLITMPVFCAAPTCASTTVSGTGTSAVFPVQRISAMHVCGYHFTRTKKAEHFSGPCVNRGAVPSPVADNSRDNYLLLSFARDQVQGGTAASECSLGDACDGGLRRTLLAR